MRFGARCRLAVCLCLHTVGWALCLGLSPSLCLALCPVFCCLNRKLFPLGATLRIRPASGGGMGALPGALLGALPGALLGALPADLLGALPGALPILNRKLFPLGVSLRPAYGELGALPGVRITLLL